MRREISSEWEREDEEEEKGGRDVDTHTYQRVSQRHEKQ